MNGKLTECLHRVCVEKNSVLPGDQSDLFYGLDGTDLVIGGHHRDQDRLWPDLFLQILQTDDAVLIHIQIGDLRSALFRQVLAGMENGVMLDLRGDDMVSFILISLESSLQSPVVSLGAASGEIDLFFLCAQYVGDLFSGRCDAFFAPACQVIYTGWIPIQFTEIRQHRLHNLGGCSGGRRIIQIYHLTHCLSLSSLLSQKIYFLSSCFFRLSSIN